MFLVICRLQKALPSPVDRKSKRVHKIGDWEEEMDAKRNGGEGMSMNALELSISRRRKRLFCSLCCRLHTDKNKAIAGFHTGRAWVQVR